MCAKSFLAGFLGSPSDIPISEGHPRRRQEDPQPFSRDGHRLWLCPGPAAATDRWVCWGDEACEEDGARQQAESIWWTPRVCGRAQWEAAILVHTHSLASRGFRSVGLTPQMWWDACCHCPDLLRGLSLKAEVTSQIIVSGNEDSPSWSGSTAGSSPIFQCFPVNCRCT